MLQEWGKALDSKKLCLAIKFTDFTTNYSIWVTMNGLAQVLGSLLMYGIGKQHYPRLEPWRVLFLVCGALTAAFGVVFYFLVPTGPQKAWFLSDREREVLLARMAQDREGGDKTNFSKSQVKETLLDVRAWFIFAFGILVTMQSPVLTVCLYLLSNHFLDEESSRKSVCFLDYQEPQLR